MPPSPIPAPLPPWAKALLWIAPLISPYLLELLDHVGEMFDATAPEENSWRHCQVIYRPVGSTNAADEWIFGIDIANITGGKLDGTWTPADYTTVTNALSSLVLNQLAVQHSSCQVKEARFYRRAFNPMSNPKPFAPAGPPEHVWVNAGIGSNVGTMPAQVALSVTEKTAYPHHWGRAYIPGVAQNLVNAALHVPSAFCDSVALNWHDTYQSWMTNEFFPVVPVTQVLKEPSRGLLTVSEIQVDDVLDVVRRRRAAVTTYRAVQPL